MNRFPISANLETAVDHMRRFWALWASLALIAAALAIGFAPTLIRLLDRWEYFNHGFVVIGMSVWLLAITLQRATALTLTPSVLGILGVAVVTLVHTLFEILDFTLGMQVMLPLMAVAIAAALGGPQLASRAAVPLSLLYFTIPIWDLTVRPLQDITTAIVGRCLEWTGITAHIDGYIVTIPAGVFEIAEGCSGMRYFVVSLAIATFYGLSWYTQWRTRVTLFIVAGVTAMVANWVRVYALILIGDITEMQHSLITESHNGFGWVVFVLFFAPVLLFARWLELREAATGASFRSQQSEHATTTSPRSYLAAAIVVAIVVTSPLIVRSAAEPPSSAHIAGIAGQISGPWREVPVARDWMPDFQSPYLFAREAFVNGDAVQVDIFVARYLYQLPDSKVIAYFNSIAPGWQVGDSAVLDFSSGNRSRRAQVVELSARGDRRVLWQWYVVGGQSAHNRSMAKLLEVPALLLRGRRDAAVIAVSAQCNSECSAAEAAITSFLAHAAPMLEELASGSDLP